MTEPKELSAEHKGLKFHGDGWEPITRWRDNGYGRSLDDKAIADLEMRVDAAIREAEARGASREREACAKLCEKHAEICAQVGTEKSQYFSDASLSCASYIRARGSAK